MNIQSISSFILYSFLIFGIIGSGQLALNEFQNGPICPTLLGIPACYIILACFIGLLIIHIKKMPVKYFYILAALPISIALYGTTFQIFGSIECPKTGGGIPMCFISLFMFSSIVISKYFTSIKK